MHLALTDEQAAIESVVAGLLQKESSPERVRAAEPGGFDPQLWAALGRVGVPALAGGGADAATLVDLSLVCEQAGRHLASAPVVETLVAGRALDRQDEESDPDDLVTFAPRPARGGVARLVPGGAVATHALVLDGDQLVLAAAPGRPPSAALAGLALADVETSAARVLVAGPSARIAHRAALADWWALSAATQVGIARASLDLAVAYVKARHQFGVPIGSFQAVQHQLADVAAALDGAQLLAREAAWLGDEDSPRAAEVAAMAHAFTGQVAQDAAGCALHLHGGYGYMLEYDVQLYFRRAKALALVGGDPLLHLDTVADLAYGAIGGSR